MFIFTFTSTLCLSVGSHNQKTKISFSEKKQFLDLSLSTLKQKNFHASSVFVEHLILTNKYTNLISKNTEYNLYRKHFLDTLTLKTFFDCFALKNAKILCLDIGTGSGFPGLMLSIILCDSFFLLVESIRKKSYFHKKMIQFLSGNNSKAISSRVETMGKIKNHREAYDFITARAVSEIKPLLLFSAPLTKPNAIILMYKQIWKINEEINEAQNQIYVNKKKIKAIFSVSSINKGRAILIFKKINISTNQ